MVKASGISLLKAIIALNPAVKTLFISGYSADILRKQGIAGDGTNFILKPISPMDLLTAVRRILDNNDGVFTRDGR